VPDDEQQLFALHGMSAWPCVWLLRDWLQFGGGGLAGDVCLCAQLTPLQLHVHIPSLLPCDSLSSYAGFGGTWEPGRFQCGQQQLLLIAALKVAMCVICRRIASPHVA
jgi:hypothetical protein